MRSNLILFFQEKKQESIKHRFMVRPKLVQFLDIVYTVHMYTNLTHFVPRTGNIDFRGSPQCWIRQSRQLPRGLTAKNVFSSQI